MSKTPIPDVVKQLIMGLAAGRCEYLGCNRLLTTDDLGHHGKFSVFAHIVADEPRGPRGSVESSKTLAKDIGNLMLLCLDHHRLIDVDDADGHSVERLRQMKDQHETRVRRLTEIDGNHRTQLVLLSANVGARKGVVNLQDAQAAVLPMYPMNDQVEIDLARLRVIDGESVAWDVGIREIDHGAKRVQEELLRTEVKHLSIFALAPIPLLMYLGLALGDLAPGVCYQRRRNPDGWSWPSSTGDELVFESSETDTEHPSLNVALIVSVSGEVDSKLVIGGAPLGARYGLRVSRPAPDLVRAKEQVQLFGRLIRDLFDRIRARHGAGVVVHVFPALPNSLAVEFGRVLLPKIDPHLEVYDFNRNLGGWHHAVTLLPSIAPRAVDATKPTPGTQAGQAEVTGSSPLSACLAIPTIESSE